MTQRLEKKPLHLWLVLDHPGFQQRDLIGARRRRHPGQCVGSLRPDLTEQLVVKVPPDLHTRFDPLMNRETLNRLAQDERGALVTYMHPAQDSRRHATDLLDLHNGIRRQFTHPRPETLKRFLPVPGQWVFPFVTPGAGTVVGQHGCISLLQGRVLNTPGLKPLALDDLEILAVDKQVAIGTQAVEAERVRLGHNI
ncbi:hypothetical protein [Pseudomonas sp. 22 E 5]|nr:hypothetical protein [Pseudomonas sp. 22 E 5]